MHCRVKAELILDPLTRERLSKLISGLLRHFPHAIGLRVDKEGFVSLEELVEKIRERWTRSDYSWLTVEHVVALAMLDPKGRFEIVGPRIRARYGHSYPVKVRYEEDKRVRILYHGTSLDRLPSIMARGILPMKRIKVHLTPCLEEAYRRASVWSKPVVLVVDARKLREMGFRVYRASHAVYLADMVPPTCIAAIIPVRRKA